MQCDHVLFCLALHRRCCNVYYILHISICKVSSKVPSCGQRHVTKSMCELALRKLKSAMVLGPGEESTEIGGADRLGRLDGRCGRVGSGVH